jgi:hypothetical protein
MPEYINDDQFLDLVKQRLVDNGQVEVDDTDKVTGNLEDIVFAVLDVYGQHGPVVFGD